MKIILLIFLFTIALTLTCEQSSFQLQSGNTQFQIIQQNFIHFKQVTINYKINHRISPQIAVSSNFILDSYQNKAYEWFLYGYYNSSNSITVMLKVGRSDLWVKFAAYYLITSRNDILLGSFTIDTINSYQCLSKQATNNCQQRMSSKSFRHLIPNWQPKITPQQSSYKIYPIIKLYLSGAKTSKSHSNLFLMNQNFNISTGQIIFTIYSDQNGFFEEIKFTYIIFLNEQFRVRYESNRNYTWTFSGNTGLGRSKFTVKKIYIEYTPTLIPCRGHFCSNNCIHQSICFFFHGQIMAGKCYICYPGFFYSHGRKSCIKQCSFQGQLKVNNICQCAEKQTIVQNNKCILCPHRSRPNNDRTACQCAQNYLWNNKTKQCYLNQCPGHFQPILNQHGKFCSCGNNQIQNRNRCIKCPANTLYNQKQKSCTCWMINSVFRKGRCQCMKGYFQSGWQCTKCRSGSVWNGIKCVCQSESYLKNGDCIFCPANSMWTGQQCMCNDGFYNINGISCGQCHINCLTCTGPASSQCLSCTLTANFNLRTKQCVICLQKQYYQNSQCKNCSYKCAQCNTRICRRCETGYELTNIDHRFECILKCDSYNSNVNGSCVKVAYSGIQIGQAEVSLKGGFTASRQIRVVQNIIIQQLPYNMIIDGCQECTDILQMVNLNIQNSHSIQFIQGSHFEFQAIIGFQHELIPQKILTFEIRINQKYSSYFSQKQLNEYTNVQIDLMKNNFRNVEEQL